MPSVVITWKGICADRQLQEELLSYVRVLAERNAARWWAAPDRPAFLELLTRQRGEGVRELPDIREFDQEISGTILVNTDVAEDREALLREAQSQGVADVPLGAAESGFSLLRLERATLRGVDFRLFDPRGLYPGEDRMSFVFLGAEGVPCLDGRLAAVDDSDGCVRYRSESISAANWYVQCPFVHLRYYLEEWTDMLFAWTKFFFMPDLTYWRNETLSNYEKLRGTFEDVQGRDAAHQIKRLAFEGLLDAFEREADGWSEEMQTW